MRDAQQRILRNLAEGLMEQAVRAAVVQIVAMQVLQPVLEAILTPLIADVAKATQVEHGHGVTRADVIRLGGAPPTSTQGGPGG